MIKFVNYDIVFREIPNLVSLALNISNCQNNCKGCHSKYLQQDIGTILTEEIIDELLEINKGINCIIFMGEGNDREELLKIANYIKNKNIYVAIYSGSNKVPLSYFKIFDYIKIGPYIKEKGPLDNINTNQKLYKIENRKVLDITYMFHKKI